MTNKDLVTVKVHPGVYAEIKAVAKATGIPIARIITFAIREYFDRHYSHIKVEEKK